MYQPHDCCPPPEDPAAQLWRYLDFTKFVALLATRTLHFSSDEGVAVRTTFASLRDAFRPARDPIIIARVHYLDYRTEPLRNDCAFAPLLHKDRSFEYEREVRALACPEEGRAEEVRRQGGLEVPVDVELLAERVVVAPEAPRWFGDLVRSVAGRYGFDTARIADSELRQPLSARRMQRVVA